MKRTVDLAARDAKCAEMGHPAATYNPIQHSTWCPCGAKVYEGAEQLTHVACCGGPLVSANFLVEVES